MDKVFILEVEVWGGNYVVEALFRNEKNAEEYCRNKFIEKRKNSVYNCDVKFITTKVNENGIDYIKFDDVSIFQQSYRGYWKEIL